MMSKQNLDLKPIWKTPKLSNGESWWGEKTYFWLHVHVDKLKFSYENVPL